MGEETKSGTTQEKKVEPNKTDENVMNSVLGKANESLSRLDNKDFTEWPIELAVIDTVAVGLIALYNTLFICLFPATYGQLNW